MTRFLSLGAGVQSSVMLMLAIRGEIEKPQHVIFADTGLEPKAVYDHVEWLRKQCNIAKLPFHVVKAELDMREELYAFERDKKYYSSRPPLYVKNNDGSVGQLMRQCTRDAKVKPIEKKQLYLLGRKTKRNIPENIAILMIGISTDEARRASPSQEKWVDREYPLIDPLKMSRVDCQSWWDKNYPRIPLPRSSCVICPYKTDSMWMQMKKMSNEDWVEATKIDERLRSAYKRKTNQLVFVHRSGQPLKTVDLNENQGALNLEDEIYCSGGCGL